MDSHSWWWSVKVKVLIRILYLPKMSSTGSNKKPSMAWCLFLLVLMTTQLRESEAGVSFKLKKLLKKILLLRALSPKKSIAILPIPIPLELIKKELEKLKMAKMPEMPMMPHSYPMYMPSGGAKMMGGEMMMPKDTMMMPHYESGMKMPGYEMMG